jgi:signal transduction histidine kinase
MHDVVAHHMSMIAVRAETAPYRLTGLPAPVQAEFGTIAAAAREALTDMRRLLGVLRAETDESPRAPQPGLADLAELIGTARRAGVAVELTTVEGAEVPEGVGLAAYRIVQEALANAARHAPGGRVRVAVRGGPEALEVEIENDPAASGSGPVAAPPAVAPSAPSPSAPSLSAPSLSAPSLSAPSSLVAPPSGSRPGHGLVGMRERTNLLGGTLEAGPRPDGGYRVAARLPLREGR